MTVDHGVRDGFSKSHGRFAVLCLLREDPNAAAGEILDEPCMVDVESVIGIPLDPGVPRHPCWLSIGRGNMLGDLGLDVKAEGGEAETGSETQPWAGAVMEEDLRGIAVVGRPGARVVEIGPDLRRAQTREDDLIGREIIAETRDIALGPDDGVHVQG